MYGKKGSSYDKYHRLLVEGQDILYITNLIGIMVQLTIKMEALLLIQMKQQSYNIPINTLILTISLLI